MERPCTGRPGSWCFPRRSPCRPSRPDRRCRVASCSHRPGWRAHRPSRRSRSRSRTRKPGAIGPWHSKTGNTVHTGRPRRRTAQNLSPSGKRRENRSSRRGIRKAGRCRTDIGCSPDRPRTPGLPCHRPSRFPAGCIGCSCRPCSIRPGSSWPCILRRLRPFPHRRSAGRRGISCTAGRFCRTSRIFRRPGRRHPCSCSLSRRTRRRCSSRRRRSGRSVPPTDRKRGRCCRGCNPRQRSCTPACRRTACSGRHAPWRRSCHTRPRQGHTSNPRCPPCT